MIFFCANSKRDSGSKIAYFHLILKNHLLDTDLRWQKEDGEQQACFSYIISWLRFLELLCS